MPLPADHPLEWLDDDDTKLTPEQFGLPVIAFKEPITAQRRASVFDRAGVTEPYEAYWLVYESEVKTALLIDSEGLLGFIGMQFGIVGEAGGPMFIQGPYRIANGASSRGLTDDELIGDYYDLHERLQRPHARHERDGVITISSHPFTTPTDFVPEGQHRRLAMPRN